MDVKDIKTHTCAWCHMPVVEEHSVFVHLPQNKYPEYYCLDCFFGDLYKEELERFKWRQKQQRR